MPDVKPWYEDELLIPGILVAGGSLLALSSMLGARVVLYGAEGPGSPEFTRVSQIAATLLNTRHVYPIYHTEDIRDAIERHPRIKILDWIGHGTSRGLHADEARVRGEMGAEALARLIAPRLAIGGHIGLAACSAGTDAGFASHLRDSIVELAPWLYLGGEVRAHSTAGHTTYNPNGRAFPFRQRGNPRGIIVQANERWILGL